MPALYPSLIAADQLNLKQAVLSLEPLCQGFHCDVMDNHFVPNLTWGAPTVNALDRATEKPLWVHLMVTNPLAMLEQLKLKPGSLLSFHLESTRDPEWVINRIREKKWRPSLALSPKTALETSFALLPLVDQLLIMSVEPGAGGQAFIPDSLKKIERLAAKRAELGLTFTIGVDGGINQQNIASICSAGGQEFVVGTAVFGQQNPRLALEALYATCE